MKAIDHAAEPCRGTMRGEHMAVIKGAIHHQCAEYLKGLKNNFHLLKLILKIEKTWLPLPQDSDFTSNSAGIDKFNPKKNSKTLLRNSKDDCYLKCAALAITQPNQPLLHFLAYNRGYDIQHCLL